MVPFSCNWDTPSKVNTTIFCSVQYIQNNLLQAKLLTGFALKYKFRDGITWVDFGYVTCLQYLLHTDIPTPSFVGFGTALHFYIPLYFGEMFWFMWGKRRRHFKTAQLQPTQYRSACFEPVQFEPLTDEPLIDGQQQSALVDELIQTYLSFTYMVVLSQQPSTMARTTSSTYSVFQSLMLREEYQKQPDTGVAWS